MTVLDIIAPLIHKTNAILDEANATPMTGRTVVDVGRVPEGDSIARVIDHTALKADATEREIELLCYEAKLHGFASVCVNSVYVPLATELLRDTPVKVCTVVGFPLGASLSTVKAFEAAQALQHGAHEVDMVMHVGALKGGHLLALFEDITLVAYTCHDVGAICKVILETSLLSDSEIVTACQVAKRAGADFVKTSTGFGGGGATTEHIALMRAVVGDGMGVKASGGVRTLADAHMMLKAGANRIGASAGVAIVRAELGTTENPATSTDY